MHKDTVQAKIPPNIKWEMNYLIKNGEFSRSEIVVWGIHLAYLEFQKRQSVAVTA